MPLRFIGNATNTVDKSGRIPLPVIIRRELEEGETEFVLVRDGQAFPCISMHTKVTFELFSRKMVAHSEANAQDEDGLDPTDENVVRAAAGTIGRSEKVTLDSAKRLTIKKEMLNYAGITDTAVFVGMGDYIRIFAPEVWAEYMRDFTPAQQVQQIKQAKAAKSALAAQLANAQAIAAQAAQAAQAANEQLNAAMAAQAAAAQQAQAAQAAAAQLAAQIAAGLPINIATPAQTAEA
ncbi:MAG: hypothetical protein FWF30_02170 [Coriobacteriia bacterium]|nr:hypothetical protein [Coriobacteriia bacterium]